MKISQNGLNLIISEEGKELHQYLDSGGRPTIGVGHLITKSERSSGKIMIAGSSVKYSYGLNDLQCLMLLDQDCDIAENAINNFVKVQLTQTQFDVLVSFTFNVGVEALRGSTLLKELNAGHYASIPAQLKRWIHDDGKVSKGLINRRNKEIDTWNS